jgi:hypothetical protein
MRWFKHLSAASDDEKIAELIDIHGAEGYGIYWIILEKIAAKMEKGKTTTNCKYSATKWAKLCGSNVKGMRKFYVTFAELRLMNIKFIENSLKHIDIDCPNLLKYRDEYTRKSRHTPDNIPTPTGQTPDQDTDTDTDTDNIYIGKTKAPKNWKPNENFKAWAERKNFDLNKVLEETERCLNHFIANGKMKTDWNRTIMNWITSPMNKNDMSKPDNMDW